MNNNEWIRNYVRYSSIVLQWIIIIVIGVFLGHFLDKWLLLKKPTFVIIFTILFSFVAFYIAFKELFKKKQ